MNIGDQMNRADISSTTVVWREIRRQTGDRVKVEMTDFRMIEIVSAIQEEITR